MKVIEVSRPEIWRYLGYRGTEPDETVKDLIEESLSELEKAAVPRQVSRRVSCTIDGDLLTLGGISVKSRSLAEHLSGCEEAFLFAATIGTGIDRLIRKYSRLQVSKAAVMQSAAAAMVESWCDSCQQELEQNLSEGIYLRPRYSPGYGDFPLSFQRPLLDALEAGKRIGIELTDSMLMIPSKSVSAVIGLTADKKSCSVHKCASCGNTGCPFRKI